MPTSNQPTTYRPFAQSTHFTRMPNDVLDYFLPLLSSSAYKILSFLVRKTWGWDKQWDAISYSQIKEGTGIKSNSTVAEALRQLLALPSKDRQDNVKPPKLLRPAICVVKGKLTKNPAASRYCLNPEFEMEVLPTSRGRRRETRMQSSNVSQTPAVTPNATSSQTVMTPSKSGGNLSIGELDGAGPVIEPCPVIGVDNPQPVRESTPVIEPEKPTSIIVPGPVIGLAISLKIEPATGSIFKHTRYSREEKEKKEIRTRCACTTLPRALATEGTHTSSESASISASGQSDSQKSVSPKTKLDGDDAAFNGVEKSRLPKKSALKPAERRAHQAIKMALYRVCDIDVRTASEAKKWEVHYAAKRLLRGGYTVEEIETFGRVWSSEWDVRCKPYPNLVTANIGAMRRYLGRK